MEDGRTHSHIEEYQKKTRIRKKKIKDQQFVVPYTRFPDFIVSNHPLMIIIEYKQKNLLSHRVTKKLINFKWDQFAALFYYTNLIFYLLFLLALTLLIYLSQDQNPVSYPELFQCSDYFRNRTFPSSDLYPVMKHKHPGPYNLFLTWTVVGMIIIRFFVILLGFELRMIFFQVIRAVLYIFNFLKFVALKIWYYFKNSNECYDIGTNNANMYIFMKLEWAEWFDITTYILALFVADPLFQLSVGVLDEEDEVHFYLKTCGMWQVGAFTITLAWINLLNYMRQIPHIGTYVIILNDIFYTFFSFVIVFAVFVLGFTFGFYTLLGETNISNFHSLSNTLLKTLVMMSGEYDYGDIFYGEEELPFPNMSFIMFSIFFILLSIILINLLVGLTVNDVNIFVEIADLKKMSLRLKFILNIEESQRNNFPQQLLDGLYQLPKIGFVFGPLRTALGILFFKRTTPREYRRIRNLKDAPNKGKMWKQVITEKVYDDRKQDVIDLKNKTSDIEYKLEKNDEKLRRKMDSVNNNFNDRIDRIEEITTTMQSFLTQKNESSKSKAEKKKTILRNLHKDFTSYEADYIFNENEKDQRMESLELRMQEMDNKVDQILFMLRRIERVEVAHQHGRDCDERYCSQPGALHI